MRELEDVGAMWSVPKSGFLPGCAALYAVRLVFPKLDPVCLHPNGIVSWLSQCRPPLKAVRMCQEDRLRLTSRIHVSSLVSDLVEMVELKLCR